jgi:hypothetical protein
LIAIFTPSLDKYEIVKFKLFRKAAKSVLLVTVFPLCFLFYNNINYLHLHKLESGKIVSHAHPFQKTNQPISPFQSHKHKNAEYFYLSLITKTFLLVISVLFIFNVFQFIQSNYSATFIDFLFPKKSYLIPNYHAPPLLF